MSYPCTALHKDQQTNKHQKNSNKTQEKIHENPHLETETVNFKYMQVQGKQKGKTSCDQVLHNSKMQHGDLKFRAENHQNNFITSTAPCRTTPPGNS